MTVKQGPQWKQQEPKKDYVNNHVSTKRKFLNLGILKFSNKTRILKPTHHRKTQKVANFIYNLPIDVLNPPTRDRAKATMTWESI